MAKRKPEPGFMLTVVWNPGHQDGSRSFAVSDLAQLRRNLARYENYEQLVVYLDRDGGESGLVAVHATGDRAWITHFDELGGVDSYCRDVGYHGPDEMVPFMLSNGQVDDIHQYWTVSWAEGVRTLEYFLLHGERDPSLSWVAQPRSLQEPA
jgi:hypothetical protein